MGRVSELPVSVRLALWSTAAFAGRMPLAQALDAAMPDLDLVAGRIERLATCCDSTNRPRTFSPNTLSQASSG